MKIKFILAAMLALGSLSYSAEVTDTVAQEVISEVRNIEAEYQALMQKEAERKEEFIQEKANLEKEVKELKEKQLGREELYAKLKEDSKIRWHREEYKKLLKRFDEYYNKLEQKIADKEQQILELTKLEAKEQARLAEEQAKAQVVENVEAVEAPAEAVVATEGLNPQDEKEAMEILDGMRKKIEAEVAGYYEIMNDEQPKPAETTEAPVAEEVAPVVETTVQQ